MPRGSRGRYHVDDAHEARIQTAISNMNSGRFTSARAAARAHNVKTPHLTHFESLTYCFHFLGPLPDPS